MYSRIHTHIHTHNSTYIRNWSETLKAKYAHQINEKAITCCYLIRGNIVNVFRIEFDIDETCSANAQMQRLVSIYVNVVNANNKHPKLNYNTIVALQMSVCSSIRIFIFPIIFFFKCVFIVKLVREKKKTCVNKIHVFYVYFSTIIVNWYRTIFFVVVVATSPSKNHSSSLMEHKKIISNSNLLMI